MFLGQEYKILDWFYIHFTENNGMAFGMELGGDWGKLTLSLFRIVFVAFIVVYLIKLVNKKADQILISSLSLVLAGAIGNIIDGVAYGGLFSDSYHQTASFLPDLVITNIFYILFYSLLYKIYTFRIISV